MLPDGGLLLKKGLPFKSGYKSDKYGIGCMVLVMVCMLRLRDRFSSPLGQ